MPIRRKGDAPRTSTEVPPSPPPARQVGEAECPYCQDQSYTLQAFIHPSTLRLWCRTCARSFAAELVPLDRGPYARP